METTNFTVGRPEQEVFCMEWKSIFFEQARFVGYVEDKWGRNGRLLLSLGRTPEEAILLSKHKLHGTGKWRLMQHIELIGQ